MKQLVLVGAVAGALIASTAFAQTKGKDSDQAGHAAPKAQPATAPAPAAPTGEVALGSVRLPKAVKADGKPLPAGTYVVRVTSQAATPDAKGQTPTLERWLEFVQKRSGQGPRGRDDRSAGGNRSGAEGRPAQTQRDRKSRR